MHPRRKARAPLPLVAGFAVFVIVLGWLVAASVTRRGAPTFPITPAGRTRAAGWTTAGDTLTLDATDGALWRRASLSLGRALVPAESARWEIAARRNHVTVRGTVADLGPLPFDRVRAASSRPAADWSPGESAASPLRRWYDYSLLTHLLATKGHVYAVRAADGREWKLQILSYYCPGLRAGCLTVRYAPLDPWVNRAATPGASR